MVAVLDWAHSAEAFLDSLVVVEVDVFLDCLGEFVKVVEVASADVVFHVAEEGFDWCVIEAVAFARH